MGNGSKNLRNRWVDSQLHYMYNVVKLVSIQISFDMRISNLRYVLWFVFLYETYKRTNKLNTLLR